MNIYYNRWVIRRQHMMSAICRRFRNRRMVAHSIMMEERRAAFGAHHDSFDSRVEAMRAEYRNGSIG